MQTPGPEALNDEGVALASRGRTGAAILCYRRALALRPDYALALGNLGLALMEEGRLAEALVAHRQAVALDPGSADRHDGLAAALAKAGRPGEAIACYRRALAIDGAHVAALSNLGNLLRGIDRFDEAVRLQRRAAAIRPDDAEVLNNLGITLQEQNDGPAAIDCFRRAVALRPDHASAHVNLAMALLAEGRLAEGSAEYEWRWRGYRGQHLPAVDAPLWDGRPIGGGTLLLWAEQGLGDTIQFIRYAPLLRARARRVVLACPPPLVPLLSAASGLDAVLPWGAALPAIAAPAIEAHVPLLGLMHRLGTRLETIPGATPYLASDPARQAALAPHIAGAGPRIGLVWSGNPGHPNDRRRSLPAALLEPLLALAGARFFSLQLGPAAAAASGPAMAGRVCDLAPHLRDLADTAAALAALDLVITVDTAVAHLAGALARPCWLLLPWSADWRWLRQRTDSPWYPTLRLFRQPAAGAWPAVILAVAQALAERLRSSRR